MGKFQESLDAIAVQDLARVQLSGAEYLVLTTPRGEYGDKKDLNLAIVPTSETQRDAYNKAFSALGLQDAKQDFIPRESIYFEPSKIRGDVLNSTPLGQFIIQPAGIEALTRNRVNNPVLNAAAKVLGIPVWSDLAQGSGRG
jgi:hypothetical protein